MAGGDRGPDPVALDSSSTFAYAPEDEPIAASEEGLCAQSLCKSYKSRPVLKRVSLRVDRGEAVALLGANGAGKTTCFYIISGLLTPDAGRIVLEGREVTDLSMHRRARHGLGYLPQESSIFRELTVEGNIRGVLQLCGTRGERADEMLEQLLHDFAIGHIRRAQAASLSGGERRRVEIARALAAEPRFILLDEPLAGVDPVAVAEIRSLIAQLKEKGIGVLVTDHNVRETLRIVDRAYVLDEGRILAEGSPAEIAAEPEVRRAYLGNDFDL